MLTLLRILPAQKKRGLTAHNRKVSAIVLDNGVECFVPGLDTDTRQFSLFMRFFLLK